MTRPGLTNERLTALFILAVLLFTPPFLGIFNSPARIWGVPVLYLYLFVAWALIIALIALAVEAATTSADTEPASDAGPRADAGGELPPG